MADEYVKREYEQITHWKVDFSGRKRKEDRWTRYRASKLEEMGFSFWEVLVLKYNRFSNPRVQQLIKDVRDEVLTIQYKYDLPSLAAAARFRREHFVDLVDEGDIDEADPYWRMGYED